MCYTVWADISDGYAFFVMVFYFFLSFVGLSKFVFNLNQMNRKKLIRKVEMLIHSFCLQFSIHRIETLLNPNWDLVKQYIPKQKVSNQLTKYYYGLILHKFHVFMLLVSNICTNYTKIYYHEFQQCSLNFI